MVQRPSFPARIDLTSGKPTPVKASAPVLPVLSVSKAIAPKNIAASAVSTRVVGLKDLKTDLSLPLGTAADSRALLVRLVAVLAAQGVTDPRVLTAMGTVQRHTFVDTALQAQAYEDTSLPIGLGQTISKPGVVARMLELLMAAPIFAGANTGQKALGRVLEIGTGCGYQAAVLSLLAAEVYSIERLRGLHDKARDKLRPHRLANVHLLLGDGMLGYPKGAPYAGIVAAAGGDAIPQAWCDQLAVGGRIVAPVASKAGSQALTVIDRTAHGFTHSLLEPVLFVPLKSGIA